MNNRKIIVMLMQVFCCQLRFINYLVNVTRSVNEQEKQLEGKTHLSLGSNEGIILN